VAGAWDSAGNLKKAIGCPSIKDFCHCAHGLLECLLVTP
jgi:hypothetical protein